MTVILKIGIVVLVCIAAASDASSLRRQLEIKDYDGPDYHHLEPDYGNDYPMKHRDPFWDALQKNQGPMEHALESVFFGAKGFRDNFMAFVSKAEIVVMEYVGNYYKALLPVVEAVPAETIKEFIVNCLKAVSSVVEKMAVVIKERNPLHPEKSPYELAKRELDRLRRHGTESEAMTLTIWGQNVGKLIGAVDDLLVDLVAALAEQMKEADKQLKVLAEQMKSVPASMVKDLMVQGLKQKAMG